MITLIKRFFSILFRGKNRIYFDVLDEYEENVTGVDISIRNVLVGALRSVEQYEKNIRHLFYHIPEKFIDDPSKIEYVALYRSKNLFKDNTPGIIHLGVVSSYSLVKREDIKELPYSKSFGEIYYRFEIAEWKTLENPIKPFGVDYKHLNSTTSDFLINNCPYFYELLIRDNTEFKIYLGICDILSEVYDGFFVGRVKVYKSFFKIILLTPSRKFSFSIKEYKRSKIETLRKIVTIINQEDSQ